MKKLSIQTYEFRIHTARKSEPFFIAYKRIQQLRGAFDAISGLIGSENAIKYNKEIWTLISATSQTIKYDSDCCRFPMTTKIYATANKITKQKISLNRMKALIAILEQLNMIELYVGYTFPNSTKKGVLKSMTSHIVFNQPWLLMFDVLLCKTFGTARNFELIILKDKNGNVISHKGMRGIGNETKFLKSWNNLLNESIIVIDDMKVTPLYYSVFNNSSLKYGGRLFAGSFSNERSKLRETIIINGESCCEVDYKNNHFRILYNQHGIDYQNDTYAIPCIEPYNKIELRTATKKAALILLNSKSRNQAMAAMIKEITHSKFKTIHACKETVNYIFDQLILMHPIIKEHFFKAEWDVLHNIDSMIARQVIKSFLAIGECVLSYHDSFVCVSRLKHHLIKAMFEAWEIVLGDAKGFGYDVEFDNIDYTSKPIFNKETGEILN